jgi:hypothetical protein
MSCAESNQSRPGCAAIAFDAQIRFGVRGTITEAKIPLCDDQKRTKRTGRLPSLPQAG